MKKLFIIIKTFINNIMVFMFMRQLLTEHLKVLLIITLLFLTAFTALAGSLNVGWTNITSEPGSLILVISNFLESFLNMNKVIFVLITYFIALIVHSLASEMIGIQTKRDQTPERDLVNELKQNTRAVVITMSNSLSLMLKLLIGTAIGLISLKFFVDNEGTNYIAVQTKDLIENAILFVISDAALFLIQRYILSKFTPSKLIEGTIIEQS
ncbi:hypothetical protein [Pseudoalteromonas sp. NBT06-2]|uniref:hypothetical protein n=1 Tax=Pseudoalteromonas sp. NBT06-2 TaxID=2025950 RepID=UPI001140E9F9|nr:hypothetical protein [Pseudoalteromonas sp. NBT06-2]